MSCQVKDTTGTVSYHNFGDLQLSSVSIIRNCYTIMIFCAGYRPVFCALSFVEKAEKAKEDTDDDNRD